MKFRKRWAKEAEKRRGLWAAFKEECKKDSLRRDSQTRKRRQRKSVETRRNRNAKGVRMIA